MQEIVHLARRKDLVVLLDLLNPCRAFGFRPKFLGQIAISVGVIEKLNNGVPVVISRLMATIVDAMAYCGFVTKLPTLL